MFPRDLRAEFLIAGPPARYLGPVHGHEKLRLLALAWALGETAHTGMRQRARLYIEEEHSLRATARFEELYSDLACGVRGTGERLR